MHPIPVTDLQTLTDVEFDSIRALLHAHCRTESARMRMVDLAPVADKEWLQTALGQTAEMVNLRTGESGFPVLEFDETDRESELLAIDAAVLPEESFRKIKTANLLLNELIHFFEDKSERFPRITALFSDVWPTDEIAEAINRVFDDKGKIRDDASAELARIRNEVKTVRREINRNFDKEVKRLKDKGLLSDTKESFVNDRRVLSVLSEYKRQVPGTVLGSSKTGNMTFIEPAANQALNNEMEMLFDDERKEIYRILRELTAKMRKFSPLISATNVLLTELDFIQAKARFAADTDGALPEMSEEPIVELHMARHPLLWLQNQSTGKPTVPQTLVMDKFSRMLVISGPNAGGKSITLKMVGLLQVMYQSGLLIPALAHSRMSIFKQIRSDIGDNQSIENQLSTYSYRLARMKEFLEIGNRSTLFLLDEFGTGSDPDLGGALAEAFFEALYNKKSFGVITTHYGNIKLKASVLRNAVNGCMLFDSESLAPLYRLSIGQPGSSFTFEVARINGIPAELIAQAEGKLDVRKVELDRLTADLQKEKSKAEELNKQALEATARAEKVVKSFDEKQAKLEEKIKAMADQAERNNRYLGKGKKMTEFIAGYRHRGKNDALMEELRKYLMVEKTREEAAKKVTEKTVKKKKKQAEEEEETDRLARLVPGATVRLKNTKQVGKILELDDKEAVVAFGVFKTRTNVDRLVPVG